MSIAPCAPVGVGNAAQVAPGRSTAAGEQHMYVEVVPSGMAQEHEYDAKGTDVNPAATSLVGGFLGTVTGLRKSGIGGAVVGGLVGGTVGYVAGAAADAGARRGPSTEVEPISISTGDDDAADAADEGSDDAAGEESDDGTDDEAAAGEADDDEE